MVKAARIRADSFIRCPITSINPKTICKTIVNGKRKLTKEAIKNRNRIKKETELKKQIDEIHDHQIIDQTQTTKVAH